MKENQQEVGKKIIDARLEEEMKQSYIDYAMSVIVGRALPDVRDGLKPVHRRILYSMYEMNLFHNKPYKKSARVVGDVLGKYHPHGDSSVYDALVRMAQDFVMNYPLIDGHGNFGSIDGDPPAAMRYTEVRLSKIAEEMLQDIDKDTVDFVPNFDGSLKEPVVLPSKFPNLLVNGSSGIAVGMATNIPPHNLNEIVDAMIYYIDNPDCSPLDLMRFVKGPDFPTGGIIMGVDGIRKAYLTGKGVITIRGKSSIEEGKRGGKRIVITEVPYQVNKAKMIEDMAKLVKEGVIEGIKDIRDESDREGLRVVIEIKRDFDAEIVLNQLYMHTSLEVRYGILLLALVDNQPKIMNIKEIISEFIKHRFNIIRRRTAFELRNAKKRAHIIEGLLIALSNIDEVIELIKTSKDRKEAMDKLIARFSLTEIQADSILTMQLQRLTSLEREKLKAEKKELEEKISDYEDIMARDERVYKIIKEDLIYLKEKYGRKRRTEIEERKPKYDVQDLIQNEEVVITLTCEGYIKRTLIKNYRTQRKGGIGVSCLKSKKDVIKTLIVCSTLDPVLIFTNKGRVFKINAHEVPEVSKYAKGTNIRRLIKLEEDETVTSIIPGNKKNAKFIFMGTKQGMIKKTEIHEFENVKKSGMIAIKLRESDELIDVLTTTGNDLVMLATKNGYAIRFKEKDVRPTGRTSMGVKGITLKENDEVVSLINANEGKDIITATENGYIKRSRVEEYRVTRRGGKGIINMKICEKTGAIVKVLSAKREKEENLEIIAVTKHGMIIKVKLADIRCMSRATIGVRLIKVKPEDTVVDVAIVS